MPTSFQMGHGWRQWTATSKNTRGKGEVHEDKGQGEVHNVGWRGVGEGGGDKKCGMTSSKASRGSVLVKTNGLYMCVLRHQVIVCQAALILEPLFVG